MWADSAVPGGGLLELSGHFEIQKVMYGFCSVKDPQAVLPKYVLVNWVSLVSMLRGVGGCAVPTGIWLGVRELAVARSCGCSTVLLWSVGWGSPCCPSQLSPSLAATGG